MAYNLKQDWEQTKRNMAKIEQKLQLDSACQNRNHDMTTLVNAYKQEEKLWYNEQGIRENAFQTTTQSLWYTHYLNKKRLQTLGMEAKYEYISPTSYEKVSNKPFPRWSYSHDGKNLICEISDSMNYRKVFLQNRQQVWIDEGRGMPGEYYIIQSKGLSGEYICPSCGYKDTLENLVDGCDYCGTKFQIGDFKEKVSSVYRPNSASQRRDGFTIYKNFWPLYFVLVVIVMAFFSGVSSMGGVAIMFVPIVVIIMMAIFLFIVVGKTGKESVEEGPARTSRTLEQLRSVDPYFSEEAFIGNLSNKLMSIYYADCMKDIRAFVECDMTPLLQARRGVFDCRLLECVLMEYHTHDQYQCLDVKVKAGLTVLQNGSVFRSEEHLRLYLVRNVNAVTQSMNDVNVYKCDSCGAGLSLLNGGKCDYCGNGLDLKKYDWVITDFMMVQA